MVGSGEEKRTFPIGKPSHIGTDNSISTSKYTIWNFFFIVSASDVFLGKGRLFARLVELIMFYFSLHIRHSKSSFVAMVICTFLSWD